MWRSDIYLCLVSPAGSQERKIMDEVLLSKLSSDGDKWCGAGSKEIQNRVRESLGGKDSVLVNPIIVTIEGAPQIL